MGPYIFSKVTRPLVKYWRSKAIRIVVYLDDGISVATNFPKCQGDSLPVRSDLFKSGFVANKDKWFPFRSFVGWVFFGISKTTVCLHHRRRFLGSSKRLLKLCPVVAFLKGILLVLQGGLYPIFESRSDVCKLMTESLHRLTECRGV